MGPNFFADEVFEAYKTHPLPTNNSRQQKTDLLEQIPVASQMPGGDGGGNFVLAIRILKPTT